MWTNLQFPADLFKFTKKIHYRKLKFFCRFKINLLYWFLMKWRSAENSLFLNYRLSLIETSYKFKLQIFSVKLVCSVSFYARFFDITGVEIAKSMLFKNSSCKCLLHILQMVNLLVIWCMGPAEPLWSERVFQQIFSLRFVLMRAWILKYFKKVLLTITPCKKGLS